MNDYELKIKKFMFDNGVKAQHLVFKDSCHSVEEAAIAAGTTPENIVKNICMIDANGNLIVAIVKGEDRVSKDKIKQLLKLTKLRSANADEVLQKTSYICGGVPSFGYQASFLVDERVMEMEEVFTGGGSQNSLIKLAPGEIIKANNGIVADIRQ